MDKFLDKFIHKFVFEQIKLILSMTLEQKEARTNRADKFAAKLQRATFGDTELSDIIDDIVYVLAARLEEPDRDYWECAF